MEFLSPLYRYSAINQLKDVGVLLNTTKKMQCIGCLSQPGKSLLAESCKFFDSNHIEDLFSALARRLRDADAEDAGDGARLRACARLLRPLQHRRPRLLPLRRRSRRHRRRHGKHGPGSILIYSVKNLGKYLVLIGGFG